jgi:hypothetical protein
VCALIVAEIANCFMFVTTGSAGNTSNVTSPDNSGHNSGACELTHEDSIDVIQTDNLKCSTDHWMYVPLCIICYLFLICHNVPSQPQLCVLEIVCNHGDPIGPTFQQPLNVCALTLH